MKAELKIGLIAGEPSGDQLGAWLMEALVIEASENGIKITFVGVGGPLMQKLGLVSQVPIRDLAVNGVTDVIKKIPVLKGHIAKTVEFFRDEKPDVLVTIDAPGFCFRVCKQLKDTGIPLVHYVAPTVWAWKPKRAKKIAQFLDHLLVLLPFEPKYFEVEGLATTFIGHPVIRQAKQGDAQRFRKAYDVADDKQILLVLPGSRAGEVTKLLPVFEESLTRLDQRLLEKFKIVLPTVDNVEHLVQRFGERQGWDVLVVNSPAEKWDILTAGDVALAASGTVSLELAAAGTPTIVGYKGSWLSTAIAKRLVKVKYASLVNILADAEIQPEYLAEGCTAQNLAAALETYLNEKAQCQAQTDLANKQLSKLEAGAGEASMLAAEQILKLAMNSQ